MSNLIWNSNNETNFLHKFKLTDTQVSKIRKAFANGLSANKKFSKTELSKMIQLGGILGELIAAIPQVMFLAGKEALKRHIISTKTRTKTSCKSNLKLSYKRNKWN